MLNHHSLICVLSFFLSKGSVLIESFCLLYLTFRVLLMASFQERKDFWKDRKNIVAGVLIIVSSVCETYRRYDTLVFVR